VAVVALAVVGCGSAASTGSHSPAPQERLTAAEFRALHRAMVSEKRAFGSHLPLRREARIGGTVCAPLAEADTDLMAAEANDCGRLVALLQQLVASVGESHACQGDPDCLAGVLDENARSAAGAAAAARGTNDAVRARGFGARCAALLGHSRAELANLARVATASRAAGDALVARDRARFEAAGKRLQRAAAAMKRTGETSPAELQRRCPQA
jgi:hypothetical protein